MLRCLKGPNYLRLQIKKYQISKKTFVLEIEQGNEVFIPRELSLMDIPISCRYYNPIINIVRITMSQSSQGFYFLKNKMVRESANKTDNLVDVLLEKLGLIQRSGENLSKGYMKW